MSTLSQKPSNNESHPVPLVHTDHLSLSYGEAEIFSDICITLQRGSFVSIVGPNGAGKTQLMRVLLGLVEPTNGYVQRNFDTTEVGYVPQKVYIDPTFPITVSEFLQTYFQPKSFWLHETLPHLEKALNVEPLLTKQLGKLSGGQLQRVVLAAALSTRPQVLFLDEFSTGLDVRGQSDLYNFLHNLNQKNNVTVIMISHDIEITSQFADTVVCMNKEMVCQGKPQEVFTAENFEKMYGIPLTKLERHEHHYD